MQPAAQDFAPFFLEDGATRIRVARFEAPPEKGGDKLCLLLNGQTEFIEKYFEVIDELRGRGFSVVGFDWRGQGGSTRLLANPLKAHIADFSQYDEDLDLVMREVVKPMMARLPYARSADGAGGRSTDQVRRPEGETKLVALAHSMGGHVLLRRLHDRPGDFAAAALCAPMIAIQPRKIPWFVVALASRIVNRETPSEEFVWGMAGRDHLTLPFEAQVVTSDPVRYRRTHDLLVANPDLRLNGPTWGWLAAALKSILQLHAPGYSEAITTPCLMFGAGADMVCNSAALKAFAARMPNARYIEIAGAAHELLMERDIFRDQVWKAFDAFMQNRAGTAAPAR